MRSRSRARRRMRSPVRRVLALFAIGAALLAASACAPATAPARSTASPSASPAPTPSVSASPVPSVENRAARIVAAMSPQQRAAAVVMGNIPGTDPAALRDYMARGYGGFILMGPNIPTDAAALKTVTTALTPDPALPPLLATDEEGGDVTRLPWDDQPAADTLKAEPPEAVAAAFAARGRLLQEGGVNVNFGVIADVASSPDSFIYDRSFGTDPAAATERVAAAVHGEQPFAQSTLKHFPGHGAAEGDSHHGIPSTTMDLDTWRAQVAAPFEAGIRAGAPLIMMGHLAYTAVDTVPASMSPRWHEILRHDLGFRGVIVTDDLNMLTDSGDPAYTDVPADAVRAIGAGGDLVLALGGAGPDTAQAIADRLTDAVARGELPARRLEEAAEHVVALRLQTVSG